MKYEIEILKAIEEDDKEAFFNIFLRLEKIYNDTIAITNEWSKFLFGDDSLDNYLYTAEMINYCGRYSNTKLKKENYDLRKQLKVFNAFEERNEVINKVFSLYMIVFTISLIGSFTFLENFLLSILIVMIIAFFISAICETKLLKYRKRNIFYYKSEE